MAEPGLHASIWASKTNGDVRYVPRPGDWNCPVCGFSNYQRRSECFRCSYRGLKEVSANGYGLPNAAPEPEPMRIRKEVGGRDEAGPAGGPLRQKGDSMVNAPQLKSGEQGLATSRWAPRNYEGRAKAASDGEIWTRTVPVSHDAVASSKSTYPIATIQPDLGLPYEVQHYILAMMQRILEEGCYEFASRWIPTTLSANSWTCSEAVELSTWKKFLPDAIPYKAISPVPNYSLEQALADAVMIRNRAVHRHLCDNVEICRMTSQAQDLMFMFSDITRQNKFGRLREELKAWDSGISDDLQEKRSKFESALREISERPVDDMDWSPNSVTLQEITSGPESLKIEEPEEYIDEMEVD